MAPRAPAALLSLPDETLLAIFALLAADPRGGGGCRAQRALAAACARLQRLYRSDVVRSVAFGRYAPADDVRRALDRFPRAEEVRLRVPSHTWVDVAACAGRRRVRRVRVTGARLCGGGVRDLVARCQDLDTLVLDSCAPAVGDAEVADVIDACGARLRELGLHRSGGRVTDAAGRRLGELSGLRALDLSWCDGLRAGTFLALAALARLEELSLARTRLCDAAAAAAFPALRRLTALDVSQCAGVSGALLATLPPSLAVLRAHGPHVLADGVPPAALARLRGLRELHASSAMRLTSWAPLGAAPPRLVALDLSWSALTDASVAEAVRGMRALRELQLSSCAGVGDATARAVAGLGAVQVLGFGRTGVTADGVRVLAAGDCCRSLRKVNLRGCKAAVDAGKWADAAVALSGRLQVAGAAVLF
jgi:hypothetical protein